MITSFFAPKSGARKRPREDEDHDDNASTLETSSVKCIQSLESPKHDAVVALLEHLTDDSWKSSLQKHFETKSFINLANFVAKERSQNTVYPTVSNTFAALNYTPLDAVKVVIVGQDPYHGPNQAHGLCFSVLRGQKIPPSLINIYKELQNDPDVPFATQRPAHGHLIKWAQQGVLLLNTVMTVRKGEPNSHANRGWEVFTDEVLRQVATRRDNKIVFLLWGKPAQQKAAAAAKHHTVICTSHPSPLGATKTNQPFLGSRCFSRCNQALIKAGLEPINWNVD